MLITCAALAMQPAAGQSSPAKSAAPAKGPVQRGQYLATFGGCGDCHTPKNMTDHGPAPDASRLLSGHRADDPAAAVPSGVLGPGQWGALASADLTAWAGPWGISFAANLTPDNETGIGRWTAEQFIKTMRTGKHFGDGRAILPPMPWFDVAVLTDQDMKDLFAYLKSLKPVVNKVPQPVPPK